MSFNICCRGTLGSLAMFTANRNASSRDSRFIDMRKLNANRAILVARQVRPVLYNLRHTKKLDTAHWPSPAAYPSRP